MKESPEKKNPEFRAARAWDQLEKLTYVEAVVSVELKAIKAELKALKKEWGWYLPAVRDAIIKRRAQAERLEKAREAIITAKRCVAAYCEAGYPIKPQTQIQNKEN